MDDIIKKVVRYTDEKLALITAMISVISIIVTAVFRAGTYLYYKGYYDFWNIPSAYIVVNYNDTLFKFLLSMSLVIIVIGISSIYMYYFRKIAEKNKGLNKILKLLCMMLIIPIFSICIFLVYMTIEFSIDKILNYLCNMTSDFFATIISISIILFLLIILAGQWGYILYEEENRKEKQKIDKVKFQAKIISWMVGILVLILSILWLGYIIYDAGRNRISEDDTINVVYMQNKYFVVITQYDNKWILKECMLEEDGVMINSDHYMIENIIGYDILIKKLPVGNSLQDCIVEGNTYRDMVDK